MLKCITVNLYIDNKHINNIFHQYIFTPTAFTNFQPDNRNSGHTKKLKNLKFIVRHKICFIQLKLSLFFLFIINIQHLKDETLFANHHLDSSTWETVNSLATGLIKVSSFITYMIQDYFQNMTVLKTSTTDGSSFVTIYSRPCL